MVNARLVAVKALVKINRDAAYSNITLDNFFAEYGLDSKDKALATALVYGVLDRKITIDYVIGKFSKIPLRKISPLTLEAIRIGIYQLLFLERIPESAAVNESVNIVKRSKEGRNAGFVNAILRNAIRNPIALPLGDGTSELSVRFSCPQSIIDSFKRDYGIDNAIRLLEASLVAPDVIIRVNSLKTTADELLKMLESLGVSAEKTDFENSLKINGGIDIKNNELYKNGYFYVQDLASQIAVSKLAAKAGERVLDICAAPGGKSFFMALSMENKGEIVSTDLYEHKVRLIGSGAKRLGLSIIKPQVADAASKNPDMSSFDAVLCDVPCSGWGVLRRKPEIKYKEIKDFCEIEGIQKSILNNAAKYLKSGGRILYSTCTLRCAENEGRVEEFLKENPDFSLGFQHTFMPHIDNTDGFFCALLYKK